MGEREGERMGVGGRGGRGRFTGGARETASVGGYGSGIGRVCKSRFEDSGVAVMPGEEALKKVASLRVGRRWGEKRQRGRRLWAQGSGSWRGERCARPLRACAMYLMPVIAG